MLTFNNEILAINVTSRLSFLLSMDEHRWDHSKNKYGIKCVRRLLLMYKMYAAQIGTKLRLLLLVMMIVQWDENIYQSYYRISVPKDAQ